MGLPVDYLPTGAQVTGGILTRGALKRDTPLLDLLERAANSGGAALVQRLIHSPLVAMLVAGTPTPVDDLILTALQARFPKV